jgi:hydrogenase maturation factor
LLPQEADEDILMTIMQDQHKACKELGICVIGGHTEVAPDLGRPIVSGFMIGEAHKESYVTTGGAQIGDYIILTKGIGIEGTGILASDMHDMLKRYVSETTLIEAKKLLNSISVVPEAQIAIKVGGVNSMHTPTEGGVLNGLLEINEASGKGFKIYKDKLLILDETRFICETLNVDPLRLLSSGSLLIIVEPGKSSELINNLRNSDISANIIGEITSKNAVIEMADGSLEFIDKVEQDELFRILEENT